METTRTLLTYTLVLTAVLVGSFLREIGLFHDPSVLGALELRDAAPLALNLLLVWIFAVLAIRSRLFEVGGSAETRAAEERAHAAGTSQEIALARRYGSAGGRS